MPVKISLKAGEREKRELRILGGGMHKMQTERRLKYEHMRHSRESLR